MPLFDVQRVSFVEVEAGSVEEAIALAAKLPPEAWKTSPVADWTAVDTDDAGPVAT